MEQNSEYRSFTLLVRTAAGFPVFDDTRFLSGNTCARELKKSLALSSLFFIFFILSLFSPHFMILATVLRWSPIKLLVDLTEEDFLYMLSTLTGAFRVLVLAFVLMFAISLKCWRMCLSDKSWFKSISSFALFGAESLRAYPGM